MLCVPLTDQTRGCIGARELSLMKPNATLINIARGAVVDTEALTEALVRSRIAAAALDVTEPEPLPRDHPLLSMPNVVITPHLAAPRSRPAAGWPSSRSRTSWPASAASRFLTRLFAQTNRNPPIRTRLLCTHRIMLGLLANGAHCERKCALLDELQQTRSMD